MTEPSLHPSAQKSRHTVSRQWILHQYPQRSHSISGAFKLIERPLHPSTPSTPQGTCIPANKILLRTLWFSNDPAQRTRINNASPDRLCTDLMREGDVMSATAIGEVIESSHPEYRKGDLVRGAFGWSEYVLVDTDSSRDWQLVKIPPKTNPADFMAMGGTALTAYFGLLSVGAATSADKTIVVSAAAAAIGSIVTQIAKNVVGIKRVVGIAGSEAQCEVIKERCGADIALNYKSPNFRREFEEATPEYVDIYFDVTGGEALELSLRRIARNGRVVACGAIFRYDSGGEEMAVSAKAWTNIIFMKARVEGFTVSEFKDRFPEAREQVFRWVRQGKIHPLKTVWRAKFEELPQGMVKLLKGEHVGKLVTEIITE
ncbi:NAD(P)-binding protein [Tuber magnatum]|uniref:NAD(P)-binding protein n=1 Tax=Tuber magnatum TaxID=42249 RepID=A0A317SL91_9PEZI|nr:NAD(P)-binding protein [Tuber magnatum]